MKQLFLHDKHMALGAQMAPFAGFLMPVRYQSERLEHQAVRKRVGLFDVSHMGEALLEGRGAVLFANRLITNDVAHIADGQAVYAGMLYPNGTFVDDVVAYRIAADRVFICLNASNVEKDLEWMRRMLQEEEGGLELSIKDQSAQTGQLAIQGPLAKDVVAAFYQRSFSDLHRFHFWTFGNHLVARTGYTGEDGFELFLPLSDLETTWDALMQIGKPLGMLPCGLSARDTLRLEAGLCLYGNDIDATTGLLEAGLAWTAKWDKEKPFIGQEACLKQREHGLKRHLVGFEIDEPGVLRHGHPVFSVQEEPIGQLTSGTFSPSLGYSIALGYVGHGFQTVGTQVLVRIRERMVHAHVVKRPFYSQKG